MSLIQKWLFVGAAVALFNLMLLIVFGDNGLIELSRLRDRQSHLAEQNQILARENVDLHRTISRLRTDPIYIESVARNELGMVGEDDVILMRAEKK